MLDIAIFHPDGPADTGSLRAWLIGLPRERIDKIVLLGKTEGPATLNDYSRELAQSAVDRVLREITPEMGDWSFSLFSTGCEGVATPVTIAIADIRQNNSAPAHIGLAVGFARSQPLPASLRCGIEHIDAATEATVRAMADGDLHPDQVGLVLVKSPILVPGSAPDSEMARHSGSTGSSRGAAAIGAGIALGEIERSTLSGDPVKRDQVFARRVMAFSGTETDRIEVVVLGMRRGGDPRWAVTGGTMSDLLDVDGVARIKEAIGGRSEMVFFKAGIASDGRLRGRRTTVLTSELPADKQLRAAASGVIAAHFGTTCTFISGGAEHQAPSGGCICAALFRV